MPTAPATEVATIVATEAATGGGGLGTLPGQMAGVEELSTLVGLLIDAGLVPALSEPGPFTVFAPTNEAFAAVPPAVLGCIASNDDWLTQVLLYHVVPGSFPASVVTSGGVVTLPTLQGDAVVVNGDDLTVNGNNIITGPDVVTADNGVAHAINGVLIPPSLFDDIVACATPTGLATALPTTFAPGTETPRVCAAEEGDLRECYDSIGVDQAQSCDSCVADQIPTSVATCADLSAAICQAIATCNCGTCEGDLETYLDCAFQTAVSCSIQC